MNPQTKKKLLECFTPSYFKDDRSADIVDTIHKVAENTKKKAIKASSKKIKNGFLNMGKQMRRLLLGSMKKQMEDQVTIQKELTAIQFKNQERVTAIQFRSLEQITAVQFTGQKAFMELKFADLPTVEKFTDLRADVRFMNRLVGTVLIAFAGKLLYDLAMVNAKSHDSGDKK